MELTPLLIIFLVASIVIPIFILRSMYSEYQSFLRQQKNSERIMELSVLVQNHWHPKHRSQFDLFEAAFYTDDFINKLRDSKEDPYYRFSGRLISIDSKAGLINNKQSTFEKEETRVQFADALKNLHQAFITKEKINLYEALTNLHLVLCFGSVISFSSKGINKNESEKEFLNDLRICAEKLENEDLDSAYESIIKWTATIKMSSLSKDLLIPLSYIRDRILSGVVDPTTLLVSDEQQKEGYHNVSILITSIIEAIVNRNYPLLLDFLVKDQETLMVPSRSL
jgi:hypothetical protein